MAEPVELGDQLRRYADAVEAHWWADGGIGGPVLVSRAPLGPPQPGHEREPFVVTGPDERCWPVRRLLTAAAAVVLAVAAAGAVLAAVREVGYSINTGDGPTTTVADGGVGRPDGSGGVVPEPPGVSEAADRCRQALQEMDDSMVDPNEPDMVVEPMAVPDGIPVTASQLVLGGSALRVAFEFDGKLRSCVVAGSGDVSMDGLVFAEDDALPVEADAIQPRGFGGGPDDWIVQGEAGSEVTGVHARLPDGSTFEGLVAGGWFIVDVSWPDDVPPNQSPDKDVTLTWTLADGTERSSRADFLTPTGILGGGAPCAADPACIPAKVAEVQAEAARRQAVGEPFAQGAAVADGVISEEEFDAAMASFVSCSVANGLSGYVAPASRFRDWAILTTGADDPGWAVGYDSLLWRALDQPTSTGSNSDRYFVGDCRTTHVDLISTLVSLQEEKRRFDENVALTTVTTGG